MDIQLLFLHTDKQDLVKLIRIKSLLITSISGVEEKLARDTYVSDQTEGIIPRAVRYLW